MIAESLLTAPCAPLLLSPAPTVPVTMPFLGLRFPPHPLSERVQELYQRTGMRVVPDTIDTGAMLLTASGEGKMPQVSSLPHVDLRYSNLRALSPIQADQFLAIGVRAAATYPIFVHGKAWGALLWSVIRLQRLPPSSLCCTAHCICSFLSASQCSQRAQEGVMADGLKQRQPVTPSSLPCATAFMRLVPRV